MQPSSDVRVGARRATEMRARTIRRSTPHCRGGRPGRDLRKSLWSALQTHLQGVDGATLAIVPEKCRHRAALLSRTSYAAKISGPAKEGKPCPRRLTSEKPERSRGRWHHRIAAPRTRATRFGEIRRWRACARFRRRLRRCGRPARRSARSAGACRGNNPAPRRSPRPTGS
jgi:hypothetical protein